MDTFPDASQMSKEVASFPGSSSASVMMQQLGKSLGTRLKGRSRGLGMGMGLEERGYISMMQEH